MTPLCSHIIFCRSNPSAAEAILDPHKLSARVAELSGRNAFNVASVREYFRQNGSVYIACASGSPGREKYGKGFIVQRVS